MTIFDLPDDSYLAALPADLQALADHGAMVNVFRSLLRSPEIAAGVIRLGADQFASSSLEPVDRELAILATGALFDAPYEVAQHEPISRSVGVTDDQRAAVARQAWADPAFTPAQTALLHLIEEAAEGTTFTPATLAQAEAYFSDRQIIDVIVQIGYYFMIARITTLLNVPLDPPADARVLKAGLRLHADEDGVHA